jgi:hypothetical protein
MGNKTIKIFTTLIINKYDDETQDTSQWTMCEILRNYCCGVTCPTLVICTLLAFEALNCPAPMNVQSDQRSTGAQKACGL